MTLVVAAAVGFLFGSIPFGYLLVRLSRGIDVRGVGSGNIGATNVFRVMGPVGWLATLMADAGKGVAGVAAGWALGGVELAAAAAFAAVAGHCFSPWLGGLGGKGVATMIGAFAALSLPTTAVATVCLVAAAALTRTMSIGSIVGAVVLPAAAWWRGEPAAVLIAASTTTLLVVARHAANLRRLLDGTETRRGGGDDRR